MGSCGERDDVMGGGLPPKVDGMGGAVNAGTVEAVCKNDAF